MSSESQASHSAARQKPGTPAANPTGQRCGEVVDLEAARRRIPGGPEAIREMARLLLEESATRLEEIRAGLAGRDASRVQRGAHTLKGAADVFAAKGVFERAQRVERLARAGELEGAGSELPELEEQVARLRAVLESLIGSGASGATVL